MRALLIAMAALLAAVWALTFALHPGLPDQFPAHFDLAGNPDRWASKAGGAWYLLPALATGLALMMFATVALVARQPGLLNVPGVKDVEALPSAVRAGTIRVAQQSIGWIGAFTIGLFGAIQLLMYRAALGHDVSVPMLASIAGVVVAILALVVLMALRVRRIVRNDSPPR